MWIVTNILLYIGFPVLENKRSKMGYQEVQRLQATRNGNGAGLTHEMQARCHQVAAELRFIGDALEISYSRDTAISSRGRILIGATLLGIATNIAMRFILWGNS